jgi:hypothetical protein
MFSGLLAVLVLKAMSPTTRRMLNTEFTMLFLFIRELTPVMNAPRMVAAVMGRRGRKRTPRTLKT